MVTTLQLLTNFAAATMFLDLLCCGRCCSRATRLALIGVALGVSGELVLNGDWAGCELLRLKNNIKFSDTHNIPNKRTC